MPRMCYYLKVFVRGTFLYGGLRIWQIKQQVKRINQPPGNSEGNGGENTIIRNRSDMSIITEISLEKTG